MIKSVFKSSSLATADSHIRKYPWRELNIGESFGVAYNEIKKGSLATLAYRTGKRLGKKFRLIDHGEQQGYEVACISVGNKKETNPTIGWNSSRILLQPDNSGRNEGLQV